MAHKVAIIIGANTSKYWASVEFEDKNGVVHARHPDGERKATINSNMLVALIESIKLLNRPCIIDIYTESEYVIEPVRKGWLNTWEKAGWKNAKGQEVKNKEEWRQLKYLLAPHTIKFVKMEGKR